MAAVMKMQVKTEAAPPTPPPKAPRCAMKTMSPAKLEVALKKRRMKELEQDRIRTTAYYAQWSTDCRLFNEAMAQVRSVK